MLLPACFSAFHLLGPTKLIRLRLPINLIGQCKAALVFFAQPYSPPLPFFFVVLQGSCDEAGLSKLASAHVLFWRSTPMGSTKNGASKATDVLHVEDVTLS